MKYLLIALLSLSAFAAVTHAQDRQVNGFMEIPWGTSPDQARTALEARSHATYDSGASSPTKRWWNGGAFAGYPAAAEHSFVLEFYDNKLCKAVVFLKPASSGHKEEFKAMKKLLTEKYGPRNSEHTQGEEWRSEWKLMAMGKQQVTITLENSPGSQGCKVIYALHALDAPASSATSGAAKKDL
jgi:hypothetical protein